jgi:hypothetical protein
LSAANHVQVVAVVEACSSYLQVWKTEKVHQWQVLQWLTGSE